MPFERPRRSRRRSRTAAFVAIVVLIAGACSSAGTSKSDARQKTRTTSKRVLDIGPRPTQVDVTKDLTHRYGEAEVAVNPRNPNNLVYFVMSQHWTYACQRSGDPECQPKVGPAPNGYLTVPGFIDAKVFVTFDRGRTWKNVKVPGFPSEHPDLLSKSDPMVTATTDGTFYVAWDDLHMTDTDLLNTGGVLNGGVAVSKSTDGGRTWSEPVLTQTPEDRAWLVTDPSTNKLYVSSGLPSLFGVKDGLLGPRSTGDRNAAIGNVNDRWLVASTDGVHWTAPHRFGGGGVPGVSAGMSSMSTAANRVFAATFHSTDNAECRFLLHASAPCTGFQTTRDDGVTWTRDRVPVPSSSTGFAMVAADPTRAGHFAVAVMNAGSTQFLVYRTTDTGATWRGPTKLTDNAKTTKFKPWMAYSPTGTLGMMWRSYTKSGVAGENETAPAASGDDETAPYNVWAVISRDGGATFSAPLNITTAPSRAADPKQKVGGDDFSFINLDTDAAFIAWADWRPGEMSGYFSAIDLSLFQAR